MLFRSLAAYWFSVRASIAHLLYHQNLDPICVALRPISGYAPLRSPCTTPTPLHSLLGNSDANFPTQIPYDATQGVVQDTYPLLGHVQDPSHALPWNTIAPFDDSVRNRTLHSLPAPLY